MKHCEAQPDVPPLTSWVHFPWAKEIVGAASAGLRIHLPPATLADAETPTSQVIYSVHAACFSPTLHLFVSALWHRSLA